MIDIDITIVVQLVNFIVTLFVLNFLLIRPIRGIIKQRAEAMSGMISEAENFTQNAEEKLKKYEAALAEARAAGVEERIRFKDEAVAEEKSILETAGKEAQDSLGAARTEISAQAKSALEGLKGQVGPLAQKAADKILG